MEAAWIQTVGIWNWLMDHLIYINLILSIIIVFFQRRDPKAVWTWLLALYFIPVFGILFYLLLGQDMRKGKMFRVKEVEDRVRYSAKNQEEFLKSHDISLVSSLSRDYSDLVVYNLETSGAVLTVDNTVDIFTDGEKKFKDLRAELSAAVRFIHMQYYIIKDDELFDSIIPILIERARAGVEVRILCDGMGGRFMPKDKWNRLKDNGVKVGIFFPPYLGRLQLRVNYRNHRKIVVIDNRVGYVGGFNIGREYISKDTRFGYWRDTHLKLMGGSVLSLQIRFALDWNNYIRLFSKARDHIYIQTPYFVPDDAVLTTLQVAARSGVDVRLMIPCKPDHPFVYWASYSYVGDLISAGARCYTYENGFLHSKGVMTDGKVSSYGTANMDIRSFELNFEVNAVIYDEETTRRLEELFLRDLERCKEITREVYEERNLFIRIKEQGSRLLSPLL